ncbi:MAG: hypothetical protein AABY62_03475 [Pseudomonadota bacterium]
MSTHRFLASLSLALLLLSMQGLAVAHELDHVTGAHDAPCALHVFANDLPGTPSTSPIVAPLPLTPVVFRSAAWTLPVSTTFLPFSARAPPSRV